MNLREPLPVCSTASLFQILTNFSLKECQQAIFVCAFIKYVSGKTGLALGSLCTAMMPGFNEQLRINKCPEHRHGSNANAVNTTKA
jgi:hypothetical protein